MTIVASDAHGRIGRAGPGIIGETPEPELAVVEPLADIDNAWGCPSRMNRAAVRILFGSKAA